MPLLFLSSAFFPVTANPTMKIIAMFNPLFYMVDGLRGSLIVGVDTVNTPLFNLIVVTLVCIFMMSFGSYLFNKSEV
jgi:ABC-type polysaccharide/polyol phosphate export permease